MKNLALLASIVLGACTVGEVQQQTTNPPPTGDDDQPLVDAPIGADVDAPAAALCATRSTTIGTAHVHGGGGGTHAGENCMGGGACHGQGGGGGQFQFAGTLYKAGTTTPDPGVLITITPDNTAITPIKMVTDSAGNFSRSPTTGALPASVAVSVCDVSPNPSLGHQTVKLAGNTTPQGGQCNGCHGVTQGRIQVNP